jgi:hypothetical protein
MAHHSAACLFYVVVVGAGARVVSIAVRVARIYPFLRDVFALLCHWLIMTYYLTGARNISDTLIQNRYDDCCNDSIKLLLFC